MNDFAAPVPIDRLLAHREWVRRVARAMVRDENDADDLEQGLWLEALQRPPRSGRSLRGWLFTALRRDSTDVRRSEECRAAREESQARAEAIPSAEELIAKADAHKRVVVAVMDLAEPYRSTILYRFFENLPPSAIAERQGVPVETVRTRLKRALAQLRERFDAESDGDRSAWTLALVPLVRGHYLAGDSAAGSGMAAKVAGGIAVKTTTKLGIAALVLFLGIGIGWELGGATAAPVRAVTESATAAGPQHASTDTAAADSGQVEDQSAPRIAQSTESADAAGGDASRTSGAPANAGRPGAAAAPAVVATTSQPPIPPDLPDDPPGKWEVVGRVLLAPRRTPVAGAVVKWIGPAGDRSVTTGSNGVFRMILAPGNSWLRASLDGHSPRAVFLKMPQTAGLGGIDVVFGDGGTLEGRVVGPDGGMADIEIAVVPGSLDVARIKQSTDDAGRFRFDDMPGGRVWVSANVQGALRSHYADVAGGGTARVDFDLSDRHRQAALAGRVTDRGAPVTGVFVQVGSTAPDGAVGSGKVDDAGEFRVEGLETGACKITVQRFNADRRAESFPTRTATLVPGENRVDLAFGEGDFADEVAGRVLKSSTGAPLDGVMVRLYPLEEKASGAWVATSPAPVAFAKCRGGAYAFHGLADGRYRLVAEPDGRTDVRATNVDFDLARGDRRAKFDVAMEDARPRPERTSVASLAGSVIDSAGRPITFAGVETYAADTDARSGAIADGVGGYVVDGVVPGPCRVVLQRNDYSAEVAETVIARGPNVLTLRVPAGEATGRVHAQADGRGLSWFDVDLTALAIQPDGSLRPLATARSQPDGAFRFGALPDGRLRLVAWSRVEGLRPASADVEIVAGRAVAGVDLALDSAETGAAILVVRDDAGEEVKWITLEARADGRPVPGSRIKLYSLTGTFVLPRTPATWTFALWTELDPLLAGSATCEVRGGATVRADVVLHARGPAGTPR